MNTEKSLGGAQKMKIKKRGIKVKLSFSIALITVVYVISVSILFFYLTSAIQKRTNDSYQSMLRLYTSQLFTGFEEIENFVNTLSDDFNLNMLALAPPDSDEYQLRLYAVRHNIFSYYFNYKILNGFYLYDSATDSVTYIPDDKGHYTSFIKVGEGPSSKENGWHSFYMYSTGDTIFVRVYQFGKTQWLFAIVNGKNIAKELESIALENHLLWTVENETGQILYGSQDIVENPKLKNRYAHVSQEINFAALTLCMNLYISRDLIWHQYKTYAIFLLVAFGLYMFLVAVFVLYTRRKMLHPLQALLNGMERFAQGDENVHIDQEDDSEPEMEYALRSFNHMVDQIRENRFRIYESELERQKLMIQNVQSQINPHFFSNTTNLIYNLIEIGRMDTAQKCLFLLSDYYRYMTTIGSEDTTLKKEMDFVKSYLDIMELRFPNKLTCEIHVDRIMKNIKIPPLLIQPLAENCIKHGFTDRRYAFKVEITGYEQDDIGVIEVWDNGKGFPKAYEGTFDMQNPLLSVEHKQEQGAHVGLLNIYRRLMLKYAENASISIGYMGGRTFVRIKIKNWKIYL